MKNPRNLMISAFVAGCVLIVVSATYSTPQSPQAKPSAPDRLSDIAGSGILVKEIRHEQSFSLQSADGSRLWLGRMDNNTSITKQDGKFALKKSFFPTLTGKRLTVFAQVLTNETGTDRQIMNLTICIHGTPTSESCTY